MLQGSNESDEIWTVKLSEEIYCGRWVQSNTVKTQYNESIASVYAFLVTKIGVEGDRDKQWWICAGGNGLHVS